MFDFIKDAINALSNPKITFTIIGVFFFMVFPVSKGLWRINKKLRLYLLWTKKGGILLFVILTAFLLFGITDENFRLIIFKADNLPIILLIYLSGFFLWLSMYQATINDARMSEGLEPNEAIDARKEILVWPDVVYIELITMVVLTVFLIVWALVVDAPLEGPANPSDSPNPSKAPWYFLGLQEILVYFDPWLAGVVFPTLIMLGLIAIPYIDPNKKAMGYYSYKERHKEISIFIFGWLILWVYMIIIGTFLRGPNWSFFGPFETWDVHKLEALTNINLSEYIYIIILKVGLPQNIILREMWGFLIIGGFFMVLPVLFAKTSLKKLYLRLGVIRYSVFIVLLLSLASLPIKMYLRWIFNLKYIVAIPEFFFNI